MYKDELQVKNQQALQRQFDREQVPDFITRYFLNLKSNASKLTYWSAIKDLLDWAIENQIVKAQSLASLQPTDMKSIETEDIIKYFEDRLSAGLSRSTIYIRKQIFSGFWEYLCRTNRVPVKDNMARAARCDKPNSDSFRKKFPKRETIEQMENNILQRKDVFLQERNLAVLHVLLGTGIREIELAGLDMDDVFVDGGPENDSPYIKVLGKRYYHKDDQRVVYLHGQALKAFKRWTAFRSTIASRSNAVFLNKNGQRLNEANIKAIFRNYSDNQLTPHMCRHWYATVMRLKYGDGFATQQLGHHTGNITKDVYTDMTYGINLMDN